MSNTPIDTLKHKHSWQRVSSAWQHCMGCDKWRTPPKDAPIDTDDIDLLEFWNALDDHFDTGLLTDEHAEHIANTIFRLIANQVKQARINQAKTDLFFMEDALAMHKTPTRVIARLGSAISLTEKSIAELEQ